MYGPKSNNGKSTYLRMLNDSMPSYCGKISAKSFSSGKEHKFLMDAISLRVASIEEIDRASKQDSGLFKEVIDGDSIKLELLYSNSTIVFEPKFLLLVTCNTIPHFITQDEGVKNRSNYMRFDNQFIQGVEDNPRKGIYKADTNLKNKLKTDPNTKQAVIYMMIEEIKKFYANNCELPDMREEQKQLSDEIKNVGDYFKEFLDENYERTDDEADRVSKNELRDAYKLYSHDKYGIRSPSDTYIRDNMEKHGFTYKRTLRVNNEKGVFLGLKRINGENFFFEEDEDEDEKETCHKRNCECCNLDNQYESLKMALSFFGVDLNQPIKKQQKKKASNLKSNDLDFNFEDILDGTDDLKKIL